MKKILIVEDESVLQKALNDMLVESGYQTVQAMDGDEGLALALKSAPDLILLDLVLPKKHGLEVLKELKESEQTSSIPVIVLTNLEGSEDIMKALDLGAKAYLVKANYNVRDVLEKIQNILQ